MTVKPCEPPDVPPAAACSRRFSVAPPSDRAAHQSRFIFSSIRAYVEAAGQRMDDILKMTIFVTNMADNTDVWRARAEEFSGDFPACSLVEVAALAQKEILVEIEAPGRIGCSATS